MSQIPPPPPSPMGDPNAPHPGPSKTTIWSSRVKSIFGVVLVIVVGLALLGQYLDKGKKYAVSPKESILYYGDATEAEAKSLGDALKTMGYFNGEREKDVLLKKDAKEGKIISFVVKDGSWDDQTIVAAMQAMGQMLAPSVGGKPMKLRMIDDHKNVKKELSID